MACRENIVLAIALTVPVTIAFVPAHAQSSPQQETARTPPAEASPSLERSLRDWALRRHSGDLSPANEQADTQRPPPPGLAGDWFGLKPRLVDAGIGLTGRYVSEAAWNYAGGYDNVREVGEMGLKTALIH